MGFIFQTRRGIGVDFQVTSAYPMNMLAIVEDEETNEEYYMTYVGLFSGYILRLPLCQIYIGELI